MDSRKDSDLNKLFICFFFGIFREEKPLDLQLPSLGNKEYGYVPVTTEIEPPPRVFKEKTVTSLANDDVTIPNTFKKRKFGGKRNARQRVDDDD